MRLRVLSSYDRVSEVLFGLIMVLTFTGSLSAAEAGRADVRAMLVAALGCNLAWGVIDAVMFLMGSLAEQGQERATLRAVQGAPDRAAAGRALGEALPGMVAAAARAEELESIGDRLRALPAPEGRARLGRDAWLGALAVFLLVFLSTLPVAIPFLLIHEPVRAMRVSNAVALAMLYLTGHAFGRVSGHRPWLTGLAMVAIGAVLVALTIALGG